MINQTKSKYVNLSLWALNLFILSFSKLSEPSVRTVGSSLTRGAGLGLPGAGCASGAATGAALDCGVNNGGKLSHGNEDLHMAPHTVEDLAMNPMAIECNRYHAKNEWSTFTTLYLVTCLLSPS